jgi:hypothetical protein
VSQTDRKKTNSKSTKQWLVKKSRFFSNFMQLSANCFKQKDGTTGSSLKAPFYDFFDSYTKKLNVR